MKKFLNKMPIYFVIAFSIIMILASATMPSNNTKNDIINVEVSEKYVQRVDGNSLVKYSNKDDNVTLTQKQIDDIGLVLFVLFSVIYVYVLIKKEDLL